MKKSVKALLTVVCCLVLVVASIMGTLAYMTSRDTVTNTFTVGQVTITVDETKVDEYGKPISGAARVEENRYKLIPGMTYIKDPTMTVKAGSEESYVRMIVTLNNAADLKTIFGDPFLPQNYVNGWDSTKWISTGVITEDTTNDTLSYEFRYYETVDALPENGKPAADVKLDALFDEIVFPGTVTETQLKTLQDLKISVIGHAIQAITFEADTEKNLTAEDVAWNAFDVQNATNP